MQTVVLNSNSDIVVGIFSVRHFLAKYLAWSIASPVAFALPSISAKQGVQDREDLAWFPCHRTLFLTRLVTQSTTL